jgi:hypothetical protein
MGMERKRVQQCRWKVSDEQRGGSVVTARTAQQQCKSGTEAHEVRSAAHGRRTLEGRADLPPVLVRQYELGAT